MKQRKFLAILLAALLLLTTACGAKTDVAQSTPANAGADAAQTEEITVNKKVALILQQGGLGDQGFNDTAYAGLMECKDRYGLDINYVECTDATQGETLIRELCEAGYGMVINLEASI